MNNYPGDNKGGDKRSKFERGLDKMSKFIWISEKIFWYLPWTIGVFVILRQSYRLVLMFNGYTGESAEIVALA